MLLDLTVGVGGVAQTVAQEVERQHGDDDGNGREEQPGRDGDSLDVLRILAAARPN